MIVGLVAWNVHAGRSLRPPAHRRRARLFSLTALSQSGDAVLYSVGRVAGWLVVPVLLFLMLAFPSGRLGRARATAA